MYFKSRFSKQKSSTGTGSATPTRTGISSSARKGLSLAAASFMASGLLTSAGASAAHADEAVIPDSATITPAAAAPAGPAPGTLLEATPAPPCSTSSGHSYPDMRSASAMLPKIPTVHRSTLPVMSSSQLHLARQRANPDHRDGARHPRCWRSMCTVSDTRSVFGIQPAKQRRWAAVSERQC